MTKRTKLGDYNCPLPDWMSMLYFNSLCVPPVGGYLTNGLVAYWRMNDAAGSSDAADSSGNSNTLTLYPLTNPLTFGSGYLSFDGSTQYGEAASEGFTNLEEHDMTICAWINKTEISQKGIVNKYAPSGNYEGWLFQVETNDDLPELDWYVGSGPDLTETAPQSLPLGQWTFVSVVWQYVRGSDANTVSYYINGILDGPYGSDALQGSSGQTPLQVGTIFGLSNYDFDGSMHDVAIYNRALINSEVAFNFLSTEFVTNVTRPDLLYYKMTESNQTSVPIYLTNSANPEGLTGEYPSNASIIWTNAPTGESNALHFDGVSSYIDTRLSAPFDFTTNLFTVNLWVEPTSSTNHFLMQNQDSTGTNGWFLFYDDAYRVIFATVTNTVAGTNLLRPQEVGVQNANWDMVSVVRTSLTNAIIYLNGGAAVSGYITSPASSTNTLKLGVDPAFTNDLDGNLWLPQIWSTNLSPSDIANLYYNQRNGIRWP
jgi:hypothetical protein